MNNNSGNFLSMWNCSFYPFITIFTDDTAGFGNLHFILFYFLFCSFGLSPRYELNFPLKIASCICNIPKSKLWLPPFPAFPRMTKGQSFMRSGALVLSSSSTLASTDPLDQQHIFLHLLPDYTEYKKFQPRLESPCDTPASPISFSRLLRSPLSFILLNLKIVHHPRAMWLASQYEPFYTLPHAKHAIDFFFSLDGM